jgi:predicted ABC-type ATPase
VSDYRPTLTVIAGTNGAGKSSIIGMFLRRRGGEYFNADEWARVLRRNAPGLNQTDANGLAWLAGKEMLEAAIAYDRDYAFETTLGGNTIPLLIARAAAHGYRVVIWYVGLDGPETHIRRVRERVQRGGHDISETRIRERFERSIENLITLIPHTYELKLFDNSIEVNLARGEAPRLRALLHAHEQKVVSNVALTEVPNWAKPVFAAFMIRQ